MHSKIDVKAELIATELCHKNAPAPLFSLNVCDFVISLYTCVHHES